MHYLPYLGSIAAAVFAGGAILISAGLIHAALKARSLTELGPAACMFAAAFSASMRYTTPFSWIVASQVLLTGCFVLWLRHLTEGEQVG
jgi:hypothetical protein